MVTWAPASVSTGGQLNINIKAKIIEKQRTKVTVSAILATQVMAKITALHTYTCINMYFFMHN